MIHIPKCSLCRDLGLVEMFQSDLKTIAKCWCESGKNLANNVWTLPTIPVDGFQHKPFEAWIFKPTAEMGYREKINWWTTKVKMAEAYWKSEGHT